VNDKKNQIVYRSPCVRARGAGGRGGHGCLQLPSLRLRAGARVLAVSGIVLTRRG
jgi:hypothetical protein